MLVQKNIKKKIYLLRLKCLSLPLLPQDGATYKQTDSPGGSFNHTEGTAEKLLTP